MFGGRPFGANIMKSFSHSFLPVFASLIVAATAGCQEGDEGHETPGASTDETTIASEQGSLHVAIAASALRYDVTAIHVKVVDAGSSCDAAALAETTSALEAEDLPGGVLPPGAGPHAGAGGLFVLPSGDYRVCVTPLALDAPSSACAATEGVVSVAPSATTETLLAPSCGADDGGLDVVVALNDPPRISALDVAPSKFFTQCETATITAATSDADGDATGLTWLVTAAPPGAAPSLTFNGAVAQFSTTTPGEYQLQITATDVHSASSFLSFPLHVSAAECASTPSCRRDDGTLACGSQSPDGCFCDAACANFGDCCPDKFELCGG